jgi:hypothetical protein
MIHLELRDIKLDHCRTMLDGFELAVDWYAASVSILKGIKRKNYAIMQLSAIAPYLYWHGHTYLAICAGVRTL